MVYTMGRQLNMRELAGLSLSKAAQAERKVRPSTANRSVQLSTVGGDLIWIMPTQGLLKAFLCAWNADRTAYFLSYFILLKGSEERYLQQSWSPGKTGRTGGERLLSVIFAE